MAWKNLNSNTKRALTIVVVAAAVIGVGWYAYHRYKVEQEMKYPKFYSGNGRLEATEVYVSSKLGGRIDNIFVKEGDIVRKGDKLVQMETDSLIANRNKIVAQIENCKADFEQSKADLKQTTAELEQAHKELEQAKADVEKQQSSLKYAEYKYDQQKKLLSTNATAEQKAKEAETAYTNAKSELVSAKAKVNSAEANVKSIEAKIESYKARVKSAETKINIQEAELEKTDVDIKDSTLYAHYDGRVQNLLAHEGEVLSAGGRVMNIIALTDVYMTFYLPTNIVGKLAEGAEVKLILDAAPDYPIDAKVTFIDPSAQFTPKSVETQVEREKLMFRIKASIDPKVLEEHLELVKTGLPGVAWVKLDPNASWEECPGKIKIDAAMSQKLKERKEETAETKKAAEKKRVAEMQAAEKRADEKKAAERKRTAEMKKAAEKKAAEKKAAEKKQPAAKAPNTPAEKQK